MMELGARRATGRPRSASRAAAAPRRTRSSRTRRSRSAKPNASPTATTAASSPTGRMVYTALEVRRRDPRGDRAHAGRGQRALRQAARRAPDRRRAGAPAGGVHARGPRARRRLRRGGAGVRARRAPISTPIASRCWRCPIASSTTASAASNSPTPASTSTTSSSASPPGSRRCVPAPPVRLVTGS